MPSASSSSLARRPGPLDAAAIIVSNVIGGGILFTPPQVAATVTQPLVFLLVWVAGGALAFAGAMACCGREPNVFRPFGAIGYPVAPALFVIAPALVVGTRSTAIRRRRSPGSRSSWRVYRCTPSPPRACARPSPAAAAR